jgi:hypothetical protein
MLPLPGVPQLSEIVVMFVDESFHSILRAFLPEDLALVNLAWFRVSGRFAWKAFRLDARTESPGRSWKQNNKPHPASRKYRSELAARGRMSCNGLH